MQAIKTRRPRVWLVFPRHLFLVLPNFQSCYYNSVETRYMFYFLHEESSNNQARFKGHLIFLFASEEPVVPQNNNMQPQKTELLKRVARLLKGKMDLADQTSSQDSKRYLLQ